MTLADGRSRSLTAAYKTTAALTGALFMGMLWRQRGDMGFGGMTGMLAVSAGFCLLVFSVFGDKKKISFELLPLTVASMAVTVTGWGTLVMQPAGILTSAALFTGETAVRTVAVNPLSGVFLMLCLGFGWMPLFAFMMGRFFSDKKYKLWHIALSVVVFFAAQVLFKATVSHLIIDLTSPDAVSLFKDGLLDQGLSDTPFSAYMSHFDSDGWAKKIPGGRNYFTSIEVISNALTALCVFIYQRFALKDKTGGRVAIAAMTVAALGITAADIFNVLDAENGFFKPVRLPVWLENYGWSYWEYFTGFFIGLGLMIVFIIAHSKSARGDETDAPGPLTGLRGFFYHGIFTLFGICQCIVRPGAASLAGQEYLPFGVKLFSDSNEYNAALAAGADPSGVMYRDGGLLPTVPALLVFLGVCLTACLCIAYKNLLKKKLGAPVAVPLRRFCAKAAVCYFCASAFIYFFTGGAYVFRPVWTPILWLMIFSACAVAAGLLIMSRWQNLAWRYPDIADDMDDRITEIINS